MNELYSPLFFYSLHIIYSNINKKYRINFLNFKQEITPINICFEIFFYINFSLCLVFIKNTCKIMFFSKIFLFIQIPLYFFEKLKMYMLVLRKRYLITSKKNRHFKGSFLWSIFKLNQIWHIIFCRCIKVRCILWKSLPNFCRLFLL